MSAFLSLIDFVNDTGAYRIDLLGKVSVITFPRHFQKIHVPWYAPWSHSTSIVQSFIRFILAICGTNSLYFSQLKTTNCPIARLLEAGSFVDFLEAGSLDFLPTSI